MFYLNTNNSEGLTLIEVLISIVILVIGIFAVMSMLSSAVKGNAEVRKMTRALNVAEAKMDEFLYNGNCSGQNKKQGMFEWSRVFFTMNGVSHCKVVVTWSSYGEEKNVALETLRNE
ncbi:MAG: prepilin-type N-terminal cleavage/methylation domain-containing protein [Desulfovermiculus sp.]|nr:prepilin-type N-terminal cleavage/methylation domain-containing protein [Desulfovermiculus sp.]